MNCKYKVNRVRARIGVIGTGWWATQHHIPSLVEFPAAELVGICDVQADKLRRAADYYGIVGRFTDHRELLAQDLDGVVVAVQHAYHYQVARDALDAGVNVLVEKPMTLRSDEAWDLVDRAAAGNLHLMVGYTFHFTRHAKAAHEIIHSGRLGEIQFVSGLFATMVESYLRGRPQDYVDHFQFPVTGPEPSTYSDPEIAGGGQGVLQVTHPMGMVLWATGLHAVEVSGFVENFDLEVDLADAFSYRLSNGGVGVMGSTGGVRLHQSPIQANTYFGSAGIIEQDLTGGSLRVSYHDGTAEKFEDLAEDELYPQHAPARALVDLIGEGGENRAPGTVGARVVEFLEAGYLASAESRTVRIPARPAG
jgi:predicted dehydrogenase